MSNGLFGEGTPPYPLPGYIEEQLEAGYKAIDLVKQVWLEVSRDKGLDSPWLPDYLVSQLGEFVRSQD